MIRLGVEVFTCDVSMSRAVLTWAARLGQSKAYEGFYLALAERLGADLWTADERLFNRVRLLNVATNTFLPALSQSVGGKNHHSRDNC